MDHVWTMRGPSFANVKDKRVAKERPPGPEGLRPCIFSFENFSALAGLEVELGQTWSPYGSYMALIWF